MAFVGNTVRLVARFRDFDGNLADASGVQVTFFDHRRKQLGTPVTSVVRVSTGVYQYEYTVPETASSSIIYEFTGQVAGKPAVGRGQIPVRWV